MKEPAMAIFLSYASQDADAARRICDALRVAGLEVWFDQSELRGGDAWDASIRKQIRECALFVPMISASTNARSEGYFRLEWKLAVDRSHLIADDQAYLLPVIIDDTQEPAARVPDRFRELQWSRLTSDQAIAHFAERLTRIAIGGSMRDSAGSISRTPAPLRPTAQSTDTRQSIAVMAFTNMSTNPDDEYFADGITEEIINALAHVDGLKVAARTSCFAFKGKNEDLRAVAEKLGVSSVLEGSVRKSGSKLRVTAQLINAADGCHLWSERYDRELADVFAMQDELANAIATKLQVSMGGQLANPSLRPVLKNPEAYELMLKGRVLLGRRGRSIVESRACLERAVELDGNNPEALGLLADGYRLHAMYGIASPADMMPRALALSRRALALDATQVEALATMANIAATYDWDKAATTAILERLLAFNPQHVRGLCDRGMWLAIQNTNPAEIEQAVGYLNTARKIDPFNSWAAGTYANALVFVGRFEDALIEARRAVELDADNFFARWTLVTSLSSLTRHDDALVAAEATLLMSGRHPWILAEVAGIHAARGNLERAETVHQELKSRARTGYIGWAVQSATAAAAGHIEEARELIQKAIDAHDSYVLFWTLPAWAKLRADAEGFRILRSTGL